MQSCFRKHRRPGRSYKTIGNSEQFTIYQDIYNYDCKVYFKFKDKQ